jgi:AbrB family looped-hinge helix DNA binding protein
MAHARTHEPWHNKTGMWRNSMSITTITIGPQGRLVIPSEIRREMGLAPGDLLMVHVENQRLVLEKEEAVFRRLRQRFVHIPQGVSLSEELIAERRAASRKEDE